VDSAGEDDGMHGLGGGDGGGSDGRVGTAHNVILQSKHGSTDDGQYGPCNQSDTREFPP
jgi:hypothetical protein